nr:hypothetical protein [Microbacterium testaceum]
MSEHDTTSDDYRAGYLAGYTDRQGEVDRLENDADRFYRAAYGEERRIPGHYVTRAELEQRRSLPCCSGGFGAVVVCRSSEDGGYGFPVFAAVTAREEWPPAVHPDGSTAN